MSGHRAVGTLLQVDPVPAAAPAPRAGTGPATAALPGTAPWVTVMPLATGPATLVTVLAHDAVTLRESLVMRRADAGIVPAPGVRTGT